MSPDFVKYDLGHQPAGAIVTVTLQQQANVRLMQVDAFLRYQRGETFSAIGGRALKSPVRLKIPTAGHWLVVLDLGGASGTIASNVTVSS